MIFLVLACWTGVADPRPRIGAQWAATQEATPEAASVVSALRCEQLPVACHLAGLRAARTAEVEAWRLLLVAAARGRGCLSDTDGDDLAEWSADRGDWVGARAEWRAARGDVEGARTMLPRTGEERARLRIELLGGDGGAARHAAEGALVEDPGELSACRILANEALNQGDLAWAQELAACGGQGDEAPELLRLRAAVSDRALDLDAAAELYRRAGAGVHRAAILYQERPDPERLAEARVLLAERSPPAALHRAWMALCGGRAPSTEGLDGSVQASLARALAAPAGADVAALNDIQGVRAAVVRARLAAERGDRASMERELDMALSQSPASDPIHRARIALRLSTGANVDAAIADWARLDPDHVAMSRASGDRDLPWCAIVPESWEQLRGRIPDPRVSEDAPYGTSEIGDRIRAALSLSTPAARSDALAELAGAVPGLDALPSQRYRLGPPPVDSGADRSP